LYKLLEYKRSWIQHVNKMPRNKLPRVMKHYFSLQPGHYSSLTAPNLQPTANQERDVQCGNQQHSRELLMMGIVMPEAC